MLRIGQHRTIGQALRCSRKIVCRGLITDNAFLKVSPEVRDAVMGGRPVVALETTIYTHGFPYPENIALSDHLEQTVRDHGAIPATIGVLNGIIRIGMTNKESHELYETSRQPTTIKLSRRDISYISGLGMSGRVLNGGTTIAGTMILAHLAGIKVFATGGLGGVHRGGENSMDISADLTELGRTPVAVISSGCKSFLDIPRTLEYLETQGAGVATFSDGRGDKVNFPGFWARETAFKSPKTVLDENEAAAIIYAHSKLELQSGLFFPNPIPEEHSISQVVMDKIIAEAIIEAEKYGASGSDNTPFILDYIHKVTKGDSIKANRKLVENNVIRGSKVAVALSKLLRGDEYASSYMPGIQHVTNSSAIIQSPEVVVAGSLAVDLACDYKPIIQTANGPTLHTSNPAAISQSLGGVGHNIATALHYAGVNTLFCTPVGNDLAGKGALHNLKSRGFDVDGVKVIDGIVGTPQYVAVNDERKNLFVAMADMQILESSEVLFDEYWATQIATLKPKWLVIDANWSSEMIRKWVTAGRNIGAKIAFEPVSVQKSSRLFYRTWRDRIQGHMGVPSAEANEYLADVVTPNRSELEAMRRHVRAEDAWSILLSKLEVPLPHLLQDYVGAHAGVAESAFELLSEFSCVITKLGSEGVLYTELIFDGDQRLTEDHHAPHVVFRKTLDFEYQHQAHNLPPVEPSSSIGNVAGVYLRYYPPAGVLDSSGVVSVNGAGDTFLGVLIAASLKHPKTHMSDLIDLAQQGSLLTLKDTAAVSPKVRELFQPVDRQV